MFPNIQNSRPQIFQTPPTTWLPILQLLLYNTPHILNWVQIWTLWRPVNWINKAFNPCFVAKISISLCAFLSMNPGIVLNTEEIRASLAHFLHFGNIWKLNAKDLAFIALLGKALCVPFSRKNHKVGFKIISNCAPSHKRLSPLMESKLNTIQSKPLSSLSPNSQSPHDLCVERWLIRIDSTPPKLLLLSLMF